jgi:hypothetical protein
VLSRRYLLSIMTLSVLAACSDGVAPRLSQERTEPYLVWWAQSLQPQFSAVGATSIATGLPIRLGSVGSLTAQVVIDHSSSATTSATSLTWSHMVGADSNRLLVVGVSIRNANNHVSSVSYAGVPLAFFGARNNSDNAVRTELWYVTAPPSGSGNVTVRLSGGAKMVAGAVSFSGVDPVTPLRGLASAGSTDKGTTNPQVADSSDVNELVLSVLATEGCAGSLTPASGQPQQWNRFYGSGGGDVAGGASTAPGASTLVMSWTKAKDAKWAIATAVIKPYVGLSLTVYQTAFWAVRGQSRSLQIDYQGQGNDTLPFLQLTISDPTYVPGLGPLAVGDSVLVTVTVDPNNIAVSLEPAGMQFGTPSQLRIWYGGAGGDLNRDGVVNAEDSTIESQLLGIWYQEQATNPWDQIQATQSLLEKSFTAALPHFSRYAVAW